MKIAINGEILEVSGGGALPEGTVAVKPLTQAEYDALTDAEKQADVVYAITDDKNVEYDYSTSEMRVGTWIDGKPLYKKTYAATNVSLSGSPPSYTVATIPETHHLVNLEGSFYVGTSFYFLPYLSLTTDGAPSSTVALNMVGNDLMLKLYKIGATLTSLYVTIKYTKTTDTGGAS